MKQQIIFLMLIVFAASLFSAEPTADELIKNVNDLMNQESMKATMTMTITTSGGEKRTFEYLSYSANKGEKNLLVYQAPRRVRGQKMLMLNNADDIWAYFARTKRVRKLATHAKRQKMEGSDFSYEDMGANNAFISDFAAKRLEDDKREGNNCFVVELTKKPSATSGYSKMVMWIIKENFLPVVIDYYDEDNPERIAKTLAQSEIRIIDGIPTGMKYTMTNRTDDSQTIMVLKSVEYNVEMDEELFTERGLKK